MQISSFRAIIFFFVCGIFFLNCNLDREGSKEINGKIDRKSVVGRHNVTNQSFDTLSSLTVGNGKFAMTVDATGLQTFPELYKNGVPIGCLSEWAWHKEENGEHFLFEETLQPFTTKRGIVNYSVNNQPNPRAKAAADYFRANPHRAHLGSFGFEIKLKDGQIAKVEHYKKVEQILDLYSGSIHSIFEIEGVTVKVETVADPLDDAVYYVVESELLKLGRIQFTLNFPRPEALWKSSGSLFLRTQGEVLSVQKISEKQYLINRSLNDLAYKCSLSGDGDLSFSENKSNGFNVAVASRIGKVKLKLGFCKQEYSLPISFDIEDSKKGMQAFWDSTAIIDLQGSANELSQEIERRFILSKYLVHIQSGGHYPPQETGLTYNSWFGRPHLEMFYWHILGQALCGETNRLKDQLDWYKDIMPKAKYLAERQGYYGVRWLKMTDPTGEEGPSNVGAFLIWQQPHVIYLADLLYKLTGQMGYLKEYKEIVFETAEFMADFADLDDTGHYRLGPPLIAAQERFKADSSFNTAYEVAYWKVGLELAIKWKKELGDTVPQKWIDVKHLLPDLEVKDGKYLMAQSAKDSYTNTTYRTDHPMILGVAGLLDTPFDTSIMIKTFDWIWKEWNWAQTWGWDYPMTAMAAKAIGNPQRAIDALLMPVQKNTYLKNGHNFQDARLTLYLPGNASFMAAVAMMCTKKGSNGRDKLGFPKDGTWSVKYEGFKTIK